MCVLTNVLKASFFDRVEFVGRWRVFWGIKVGSAVGSIAGGSCSSPEKPKVYPKFERKAAHDIIYALWRDDTRYTYVLRPTWIHTYTVQDTPFLTRRCVQCGAETLTPFPID